MPLYLLSLLLMTLAAVSAQAESEPTGGGFVACLEALQGRARERGLDDGLVSALAEANRLERVVQLDRNQPEFTRTFADYLDRRVTSFRVLRGRQLLRKHRAFLQELTREYGVPPQYLVAFWGMETNFGSFLGKIPALDSLATLSCDERRSEFFSEQLLDALTLADQHNLDLSNMEGSWAGALGHTQFMPSAYRRYGIDGDGDGRVDLWNSVPDALASAANYLHNLGWVQELRWGREVTLPADFAYHRAGLDKPLPLAEWQALGVRRTNGEGLGDADVAAALLVPSGVDGPKFLVYDNFHVIMEWNRSRFYALSVGHLADRINGAGGLYQSPPDERGLSPEEVETLQRGLKQRGFDPGEVDGILGPATQAAIRAYQRSHDEVADGYADLELVDSL